MCRLSFLLFSLPLGTWARQQSALCRCSSSLPVRRTERANSVIAWHPGVVRLRLSTMKRWLRKSAKRAVCTKVRSARWRELPTHASPFGNQRRAVARHIGPHCLPTVVARNTGLSLITETMLLPVLRRAERTSSNRHPPGLETGGVCPGERLLLLDDCRQVLVVHAGGDLLEHYPG